MLVAIHSGSAENPTAYMLKVKKPGSDEYVWKHADLIETFNSLIGLRVEHMAAPQTVSAKFKRGKDPELPMDTHTKLVLDGKLKQDTKGPWRFRRNEGRISQGANDGRETVLVICRKHTGDLEQDNLLLGEYLQAHRTNTKDWEFDTIYVGRPNNLPNLKRESDKWMTCLIEEDFHRLLWDVEDV
ncbi:MAG: hypothetical protein FJ276_37440 [Planctomycetes bacterium]|nr:hypothetical protein [Planctomycetota bacterium]